MKTSLIKNYFLSFLLCLLPGCLFVPSPYISDSFVYRTGSASAAVEDLVFVKNAAGAKIIARNNIGTLKKAFAAIPIWAEYPASRTTSSRDLGFILDLDTGIGPDGVFYSQNEDSLFTLDPGTGAIYKLYSKSTDSMKAANIVVDFEDACIGPGGKIHRPVLCVREDASCYAYPRFCSGDKIVEMIKNPGIGDGLNVFDADSGRKVWWSGEELGRTFYAITTSTDVLFLLYNKGGSLVVEAYDFNYDPHARFGSGKKKMLWKTVVGKQATSRVAGLKEPNSLLLLRELFVIEHSDLNKATGETAVRVTSLDPKTGAINWQKPDTVLVFAKQYADDGLFYLSRKDRLNTISGVDQKTGEEQMTIDSSRLNFALGVLDAGDMLYYAEAGASKDNPHLYDTIIAVLKSSGKKIWTLKLDQQEALPRYERGIVYFGFRDNFQQLPTATSNRQYRPLKWIRNEDVPNNLRREACAVDARTGILLWKVRLEGGVESYIQKMMIKDDITYIKSLSGWLYSLKLPAEL